ncbi:MAG TPA: hypothetical protein VNB90_13285 [Cytophagaceae bacterium]|jgi:hypothetical protein|nr:hypothetical protein [Cytophagaceae bacterium]
MKRILLPFLFIFLAAITHAQDTTSTEKLIILWPTEYKWKVASSQQDGKVQLIEIIPEKERLDKWTIMGTMMSLNGVKNLSVTMVMNAMYDQAKQIAPEAMLTLIEKNEEVKNPWVIFKIEAPAYTGDKKPESQLYYVIQGNAALYSNFVAVKEKKLSDSFVEKWTKIFKSSILEP